MAWPIGSGSEPDGIAVLSLSRDRVSMKGLLPREVTSFLFTTPGIGEPAGGGFPAISLLGELLLKGIALLGLSFWTLADSIRATQQRSNAE
jgi:uncharacterized membrane protein YkgB